MANMLVDQGYFERKEFLVDEVWSTNKDKDKWGCNNP